MFAVAYFLLTLAALFGALLFAVALALLFVRKARAWGFAVIVGGIISAIIAFGLFAFFVLVVEDGRESVLSKVTAMFSAAGFGAGGIFGAAVYLFARVLQSPNRWIDRHRVSNAP